MLCANVIAQAIIERDWVWLFSDYADAWAEPLGMEPGTLRRHLPALMEAMGIRYDVWRACVGVVTYKDSRSGVVP